MAALVDDIYGIGLKFVIYGDAGTKTCADYPGSEGHKHSGVDLWKYDNCYTPCDDGDDVHTCPNDAAPHSQPRYEFMWDALLNTRADILYSLCNWGYDEEDVVRIENKASPILRYTEPRRFNDLDMMIIGNDALTNSEDRTHFAIWAITKSPILMGTDMTNLTTEQVELISHRGLLTINQDPLGVPATAFTPEGAPEPDEGEMFPYWARSLSNGTVVALVASSEGDQSASLSLAIVAGLNDGVHSWTELFSGRQGTSDSVSADLDEHDIAVFQVV